MRTRLSLKMKWALCALLMCPLACLTAYGQVSFVQITDPHLYDDYTTDVDNRPDNEAVFRACIKKINEQMAERAEYAFVVVTGDMGVEELKSDGELRKQADRLADMLGDARVKVWLFVPGNNDVPEEKPENNTVYHNFIIALDEAVKRKRLDIQVVDLCPQGQNETAIHPVASYAFIGFNDTSFKNEDANDDKNKEQDCKGRDPRRLKLYKEKQVGYVNQVKTLLDSNAIGSGTLKHAYIFYHIPEVDDPYLALSCDQGRLCPRESEKTRALIGEANIYSSWFVAPEVRQAWYSVVNDDRVKGLFAGHFHSNRRGVYKSYYWMRGTEYPAVENSKLHVCPPLALKFQKTPGEKGEARGFQEVYIDEKGQVGVNLLWYEKGSGTFEGEASKQDAAALKQIEQGRIYEDNTRFKDAEAAYLKAMESGSAFVHHKASDLVQQVVRRQESLWDKHLMMPMRSAWATGLTTLGALLPAAIIVLVIYLVMGLIGRLRGFNRLLTMPFIDSTEHKLGANFNDILITTDQTFRKTYNLSGQTKKSLVLVHVLDRLLGLPLPFWASLPLQMLRSTRNVSVIGGERTLSLGGSEPPVSIARSSAMLEATALEALGVPGKIIAWLMRSANHYEYTVRGSLKGVGQNLSMTIVVERWGRVVKSWHENFPADALFEKEDDYAFQILKYLYEG